MTPHLSDVAGKGDDPVRRWQKAVFGQSVFSPPFWQILLLRAEGVFLKVQNGFVSSRVWLVRRKLS